jgi:hypothetical protein
VVHPRTADKTRVGSPAGSKPCDVVFYNKKTQKAN